MSVVGIFNTLQERCSHLGLSRIVFNPPSKHAWVAVTIFKAFAKQCKSSVEKENLEAENEKGLYSPLRQQNAR